MMGGEVIIEKNPSSKYCIAKNEPLCDSIIWNMLQNYYKKAAINAWRENVVPSFVTSNSKLAKDYARVIINYMKDWFNSNECDRNVPIYILEIGAGHGKFTYLILRALSKYKKFFKSMNLPERPFVYVFTDVAKDNIDYCINNERLKKYINSGHSSEQTYTSKNNSYEDSEYEKHEINYDSSTNDSCHSSSCGETNYEEEKNRSDSNFSMLDFAFFDGNETTDKIYLEISKKHIPSDTPIVLICNYVLDSLLTDAWIVNGENDFKRALLSVYSTHEEEDRTNADIMLRMSVTWDWEKVNIDEEVKKKETNKPSNYLRKYEDIYTVLKLYSYFNQSLSFVFPVGAFILFKRMLKLSNNKLLCLIGDKGYQSYEEFRGYRDPHIVVHGSLSFMVNLNAICLFFLSLGGYYIYTPYSDNFQIVTLLMHQKKEDVKNGEQNNTSTNSNALSETSRNKKKFYIIDFFKKNIKSTQENNKNNALKNSVDTNENDCNSITYSKNSVNAQDIYKKIKKINLRNLNNMTIKFGGTIASFYDNMEQIPPDLLISWQKSVTHNINHNASNVNIKELMSLLRYSNYDSDVFFNIRNSFINLACYPNINGRTEKDILLDIKECYKNYYSLKNDEDIADICGHVCMKFGEFEKSIFYLKESLRKFKHTRHSSTYINIASCYKILRNYNKSLKFIRSAIKLANKENKDKNIPINSNSHCYDLLYNIQFCSNPISYAMIGINYYVQNDGLYYLSFENRIKLKYIFLLSKEEEKVLKHMRTKYKHSVYDKTSKNFNLFEIKIIKVYDDNKILSLEELHKSEKEEKENGTVIELNNIEGTKKSYDNIGYIKNNLITCLDQFHFQFCVIDVPWIIKSDIVDLMIEKSKHIFTYGTLSDSSKRSLEVISNYKKVAQHISWVNNNYIHDECLYEARKSLDYIKNVISITITHYTTSAYTNQNECINCKEIFINDLCSILNALHIILNFNLTGLAANFLKKENLEKKEPFNLTKEEENIEILTGSCLELNNDSQEKINDRTKDFIGPYACMTGMLMFSQNKKLSEELNVYGNYLLMNNRNEEFITKINIVGSNGSLCLKKTLSNWSVHVFNISNDKIFEKSGRISASQNSNDVFVNQYLIKTNGKENNIKHFSEYDLKCPFKDSNESIDSDIDILEFSSSDNDDNKDDKSKKIDEHLNNSMEPNTILSDNNDKKILYDRNLEILKDLPGKRFYSSSKEICENINIDENFIDITVNNNCFYSRIIEGINLSHKREGSMVYFKYNSK